MMDILLQGSPIIDECYEEIWFECEERRKNDRETEEEEDS